MQPLVSNQENSLSSTCYYLITDNNSKLIVAGAISDEEYDDMLKELQKPLEDASYLINTRAVAKPNSWFSFLGNLFSSPPDAIEDATLSSSRQPYSSVFLSKIEAVKEEKHVNFNILKLTKSQITKLSSTKFATAHFRQLDDQEGWTIDGATSFGVNIDLTQKEVTELLSGKSN